MMYFIVPIVQTGPDFLARDSLSSDPHKMFLIFS